jgi:8-oxo-dGTP pyrophosphatase MutT (NUDIX family)
MFVVNVEGAIERDGRYLMIVRGLEESHAPGALSFPGGKVEPTDEPENALESTLLREISEEVGVEIRKKMTYVESRLFDMDDGSKVLNVLFLCHIEAGTPFVGSEEVQSVRWMTPEEILRDRPPWFKDSTMQGVEEARRRDA